MADGLVADRAKLHGIVERIVYTSHKKTYQDECNPSRAQLRSIVYLTHESYHDEAQSLVSELQDVELNASLKTVSASYYALSVCS